MTSNSGVRLVSRAGWRSSTIRSNGTSWCAIASRTVSRTPPRNSSNVLVPSTVDRRTRVLTKKPIRPSSSVLSRPDTTVPRAMSVCPVQRLSSRRLAAQRGGVAHAELVDDDPGGPAVGDDVVHHYRQHMLVGGQAEQLDPEQRAVPQVERTDGLVGQGLVQLRLGELLDRQVDRAR